MTLKEMIEAHEEMITKLRALEGSLLVAPDVALSLKDVLGHLQAEKYARVTMKIETGAEHKEDATIEWEIGVGRWSSDKEFKGHTLADAFRAYKNSKRGTSTVDEACKELVGTTQGATHDDL